MTDTELGNSEKMSLVLLKKSLLDCADYEELKQKIVDAPFDQRLAAAELFLGFMVLLIVDPKTGLIDRVTLSHTELAKNTTVFSYLPFEEIKIPLDHDVNIIARAIRNDAPYDTTDWYFTFTPALTGHQARLNQASGGIAYTAIYPLHIPNKGALSFSYYQYAENIDELQVNFMKAYSKIVSEIMSSFISKQ